MLGMNPLFKLILMLLLCFGTVFVAMRIFGVLTLADIEAWLAAAQHVNPVMVALVIIALLCADLFITVPTLGVALLAGYLLGVGAGMASVAIGIGSAGLIGYALGARWGATVIQTFIRDPDERAMIISQFHRHGGAMIILARAAPMLPEITSCLAGATRLPLRRFLLFFVLGNGPYVALTVYAGAVSDRDNPMPALYVILLVYAVTWMGWLIMRRVWRRQAG